MRTIALFALLLTTLASACTNSQPCRPGTVLVPIPCPAGFSKGTLQLTVKRGDRAAETLRPIEAVCPTTSLELNTTAGHANDTAAFS
jgi:hypothetical protein